jgi:hypothetical protein
MCDIDNDEEPTYGVEPFGTYRPLADTSSAFSALGDYLDQLVELQIGEDLQAEIRRCLTAMLDAAKALIVQPDNLDALVIHNRSTNRLHDLTEQAMLLIEAHNAQEDSLVHAETAID